MTDAEDIMLMDSEVMDSTDSSFQVTTSRCCDAESYVAAQFLISDTEKHVTT